MAKTERNAGWPGLFLSFGVLCAIMFLVARSGLDGYAVDTGEYQVLKIYEGLCHWGIPALFMVWGMNALEDRKVDYRHSLLTLVLPAFCLLVVWGAIYAIAAHLLGGGVLSWAGIWSALVSAAKGNTYFHLWVLYPLMGIYLVQPVVHRFVTSASRGEVIYFLALCFLLASLLPVWYVFFPDNYMGTLLERMDIHLVLGWIGYYVVGWYLKYYTLSRISEFIIYALGIAGVGLTLMGDTLFGGSQGIWYDYSAPGVVMTAVAMCTLFRYVLGVSDERSRRQSVYRLGSHCMGIYFIHQLWVMVFNWLDFPAIPFSPVIGVPLMAVVYMVLSFPVALLIGLIPGTSKVI